MHTKIIDLIKNGQTSFKLSPSKYFSLKIHVSCYMLCYKLEQFKRVMKPTEIPLKNLSF